VLTPYATPTEVSAQMLAAVAPLRHSPDGVHRMVLQLHPAELGAVQITAELREGTIHLQLHGATEVGRDALRASLDDLRRDLSDAGISAGSLDVGGEAAGSWGRQGSGPGGGSLGDGAGEGGRGAARPEPQERTDGGRHSGVSSSPLAVAPNPLPGSRALDIRV
jgi:hypothetical protein